LKSPANPGQFTFDAETEREFTEWLQKNGIPYVRIVREGQAFVTWAEKDDIRVQRFSKFPENLRSEETR
jgi:hypothetical protein